MRVLVDGRVIQDRYHGIGRGTAELVRALSGLAASTGELELVVTRGSGRDERLSATDLEGLPAVSLVPFEPPIASVAEHLRWPSVVRKVRPDVVHIPYHLATPLFAGAPVVAVVHDCIFESDPSFAPGRALRASYRCATAIALRRATEVVTVSEATRASLEHHYGVRVPRQNVVPNGVDPGFARRCDRADVAVARSRLGLPERYMLHVGVHRPHKNVTVLVRALAELRATDPDLHLVLVGSDDERFPDPVPALVRRLGVGDRVHVVGSISEELLPAVFKDAAVFTFPSLIEGFGLPVLEAMAAGVPVVGSRTPAVAEVAGDAAILVPPTDERAWSDAIGRVLRDAALREQLRDLGRCRVAAHSWASSAHALLDVLRRAAQVDAVVVGRRGSRP
jgi:glycosyltransferase involved in cell wall biosynthesis